MPATLKFRIKKDIQTILGNIFTDHTRTEADDVGIVVPPGNVSSLIESIQELLENPVLRQTKGKKGREMILHEFSLKSYLNHYNNLYNKLMCEEKTN